MQHPLLALIPAGMPFEAGGLYAVTLSGLLLGGLWFGWRSRGVNRTDGTAGSPRRASVAVEPQVLPAPSCGEILQHRYANFLRPALAQELDPASNRAWQERLHAMMARFPSGRLLVPPRLTHGALDSENDFTCWQVPITEFYLDRHAVRHEDFWSFVTDGGYAEARYWHPDAVEQRGEWVDATGKPGPRFWNEGRPARQELSLPVVGINWYEADAFARWAGKRLPTDEEWMFAAGGGCEQRRYPWGDQYDPRRCNLWDAGHHRVLPVDACDSGASPQGCLQLIGNVWEWTASAFGVWAPAETWSHCDGYRALRGGAFDTYFAQQATPSFQSGDDPRVRRRNMGFRCCLSAKELALPQRGDMESQP